MNWLNKYKTTSDKHTHLSFSGGKYYVKDDQMPIFYKHYFKTLVNSEEKLYLIEKIYNSRFAFFLDIEIPKEKYSPLINIEDSVKLLIEKTCEIMLRIKDNNKENKDKNNETEENDEIEESDMINEYIISKRNNKYHINFPNFVVDKHIANLLIELITQETSSSKEIIKLIDTSVYNTGLRMLGSRKNDNEIQKEIEKYGDDYETTYKIYQNDSTVEFKDLDYDMFLKTIIRRPDKTPLTPIKPDFEKQMKTIQKNIQKNTKKVTIRGIDNPKIGIEISKLLDFIQEMNSEIITEKLSIGKIVATQNKAGIFCFYVSIYNKFCYFKQREHQRESSPIYVEISIHGICIKCYDQDCLGRKHPENGFDLPDNFEKDYPELYNSMSNRYWQTEIVLTPKVKKLLEESLSGSHYKIAKAAFEIYKDRFRVDEIKNTDWYQFDGIKWIKSHIMNILISEDLPRYYKAIKISDTSNQSDNLNEYLENQEKFEANMRNELVDSITNKLENVNFKKFIITEMTFLFKQLEPNFIAKLDSETQLIGFKNGVYDLRECVFREGRREDYLTFTTGYDYISYDPELQEIKDVNAFLQQIITNKNVFEYMMKILGRSLSGVPDERFYIFTGTGSNAKSTLIEFLEHTLGDYITGVDVSLLTSKRGVSSNASPDVTRIKGKRIISFAEPEHGDTLKTGILKAFSGGDTIIARELFKSPISFKSQATMIMCCNDLPTVNAIDGGFMRRLRIIDFKSKFCDNPKKINEFKINPKVKENLKHWRPYFMSMLIHWYNVYNQEIKENNKIFEPEQVMIATQKYKKDNDKFEEFFSECITYDKEAFTTVKELYNFIITWWPNNNHGSKVPSKKELERALALKYEDIITKNNKQGYSIKLNDQEVNYSPYDDY
jgi:P4 family phage/plasmid primase-like protien